MFFCFSLNAENHSGRVYFRSSYFFNGSGNDQIVAWSYPSLLMSYQYESPLDIQHRFLFDGGGILSLNVFSDSLFMVPELAYQYKGKKNILTLGRHRFQWLVLDRHWNMGVVQPLQRWDKLRPEEQGLFGLHWRKAWGRKNLFKTKLFISPLYLPNQDPAVQIREGEVVSYSPWTEPVVSEIDLPSESKQLFYTLLEPEVSDIIFQAQIMAQLSYGSLRKTGQELTFITGYKPMNELALAFRLDETDTDLNDDIEKVKVTPFVNYHTLLGVEYKRQILSAHQLFLSFLWEKPQFLSSSLKIDEDDNDWIFPHLKEKVFFSWGGRVETNFFKLPLSLEFSYLHTIEGEKVVRPSQASANSLSPSGQQSFETQLYRQALKLAGKLQLTPNVTWSTSYVFDFAQEGGHLSVEWDYRILSKFSAVLSADLLGVINETDKLPEDAGFIHRYKANDRVQLEVRYDF